MNGSLPDAVSVLVLLGVSSANISEGKSVSEETLEISPVGAGFLVSCSGMVYFSSAASAGSHCTHAICGCVGPDSSILTSAVSSAVELLEDSDTGALRDGLADPSEGFGDFRPLDWD